MKRAFTLIELLCVIAILTILAGMIGIASKNLCQRLAWKCHYIASFHNGQIERGVNGEFRQLESGDYWKVLKR